MNTKSSSRNDALAPEVAGQHALIGVGGQATEDYQRTAHPDAQWFGTAGLGLFIHWGISSVGGDGDLSWSMMARNPDFRETVAERYGEQAVQKSFTPAAYWKQAERFRPRRYEPRKWLEAAKRAGFRYAVLTTKHHDGFTLWPSRFGELGVQSHLDGRDLVGEYIRACRDSGLKVGLYYSPPDWHFERRRMSFHYGGAKPDLGLNHEPVTLEGGPTASDPVGETEDQRRHNAAYRALVKGQVEELLTRYGTIDLFWFDGHAQRSISMERIHELQPGIVVNPRGHDVGDFRTFECSFPKERPEGWWEYCHIWNDGGWGYLRHEIYKPIGWMLSEFSRARAWGGNFLPNVGPNADGELPDAAYRRFAELEEWMKHSGQAVFDVEPAPEACCNVPVTRRGNTWYLHALLSSPNRLEIGYAGRPQSVRLLRTGEVLPFAQAGDVWTVEIPTDSRTTGVDVVEIVWTE